MALDREIENIDPEEVRRALGATGGYEPCCAAAREYLRLREQLAPDVQAWHPFVWDDTPRLGDWKGEPRCRTCDMTEGDHFRNFPAPDVQAQIDAAVKAYRTDMHECEQIAGRALGYPRYCDDEKNFPDATDADGVCVGEHDAPTIVAELAEKYRAAMSELVRWRNTAANEMIQEAVAREREEIVKCIPTTWLDPLLTGRDAVIPSDWLNFDAEHLQHLMLAIINRIRARSAKGE